MSTQLSRYIARHGAELKLRTKTLTVESLSGEGDLVVGTFRAVKASYTGVVCINARVAGRPNAEVWSVLASRRELASFAIDGDELISLR